MKCPYCLQKFKPKYFLQKTCLSNECEIQNRESIIEAARLKKSIKTPDLKLKTVYKVPKQKTDFLQVTINKIIKLIDAHLLCPVTSKVASDAGHLFTRSAHPEMRYNCHAIHRQSRQSNGSHNDDIKFREALAKEYGADYIDFVESCRKTPIISLTEDERKEKEIIAREWLFRLQLVAETYYSVEERIYLRNKINTQLNIYPKEFLVYE